MTRSEKILTKTQVYQASMIWKIWLGKNSDPDKYGTPNRIVIAKGIPKRENDQ